MMTGKTFVKVEALKALNVNGKEVNHYSYGVFYAKHKGEIPSWTTLKNNGLVKFVRTGLVLVNGTEAVNANIYKFEL